HLVIVRDFRGSVLRKFVDAEGRIDAILTDLEWINAAEALCAESGFVAMLLHVPGKHPDALEVDVRIVARSSFSNDVPVDLAGDRVLNSIERLHRSVRVFLAVLRNVGGNIEFECVCENPADFGWLWPHFEPDV